MKKALRQARAARTVATIIGGFLACWTPYTAVTLSIVSRCDGGSIGEWHSSRRSGWTPYTITTIITVTTGRNHGYSVNFAVMFLAFASGLVSASTASFSSQSLPVLRRRPRAAFHPNW